MARKKGNNAAAGKKDDFNAQKGVEWGSKKKQQRVFTLTNILTVIGILVAFLMLYLLIFVDESAAKREQAEERKRKRREKLEQETKVKEFEFKYTEEQEMDALTEILQAEDDEIKVVVFDYSEDAPERPGRGRIKPKYLWKRYERIAKSLRTKELFKRYDDEDLPAIYRFDCSEAGQLLCDRVVGDKAPHAMLFKNKRPRAFPDEVKSDKQILKHLYEMMQPAVSYQESIEDVENFISDVEETIRVMFYGNERGPLDAFTQAADVLRDYGKFGRSRADDVLKRFSDDPNDVVVKLYRKFDDSPVTYNGALNAESLKDLVDWVRTNSLPLLSEFSPANHQKFQKRGLPIVWLHVDSTEDVTDRILEEAKELAKEYYGKMTFTFIDGVVNSQVAKNIGSTSMPQVLILDGSEEVKDDIDGDMPKVSIKGSIDKWEKRNSGDGGGFDDDDDDDDDDYYADDDLDDIPDEDGDREL